MQRALIIGASGTIGRAIAAALAQAGWSLELHANRHFLAVQQLSEQLTARYPRQDFIPVRLDLTANDAALTKFATVILAVNAVVFAQGVTHYGLLGDEPLADIDRLLTINLRAPLKLTHLFEPMLLKQAYSRIVFIGSVYGGQGSALESVYSATKAGLSGFAQAYSREVASSQLTVNVIAPGAVRSAMTANFSAAELSAVQADIPAGRLETGADIAAPVVHLLTASSNYLTGQTIYVSGGWLR